MIGGNTAETIAAALGGSYRSGAWWRCRCPVHHSNSATLAVRDAPKAALRCGASPAAEPRP